MFQLVLINPSLTSQNKQPQPFDIFSSLTNLHLITFRSSSAKPALFILSIPGTLQPLFATEGLLWATLDSDVADIATILSLTIHIAFRSPGPRILT